MTESDQTQEPSTEINDCIAWPCYACVNNKVLFEEHSTCENCKDSCYRILVEQQDVSHFKPILNHEVM